MRRLALALLLAAAFLAGTAADAGAQGKIKIVSTGGVVYHSEQIPAGATVQFKVTCPPGYFATGASVSSGDPRVLSLLSQPTAGRAWSFGFRNTDTANAITVVVMVNCTKPNLALVKGIKRKKKVAVVQPGQSSQIKVPCPAGETPVGDSEKSVSPGQKRASASSLSDIGGIQVFSITPSRTAVTVGLANPGTSAVQVQVGAVCMKKHLSAGDKSGVFLVQRATFNETVPPHGSVVSGACPGQLPLMAGFSLAPAGPAGFLGAGFSPGKFNAHWAFSNPSQQSGQAKAILACTPGKLKFVKGLPAGTTSIDTQVGPITISG